MPECKHVQEILTSAAAYEREGGHPGSDTGLLQGLPFQLSESEYWLLL